EGLRRALGLRAPQGVGGNLQLAHAVVLDPGAPGRRGGIGPRRGLPGAGGTCGGWTHGRLRRLGIAASIPPPVSMAVATPRPRSVPVMQLCCVLPAARTSEAPKAGRDRLGGGVHAPRTPAACRGGLRSEPRQCGGMGHRATPRPAPTRDRGTSMCRLPHPPALPRLRELPARGFALVLPLSLRERSRGDGPVPGHAGNAAPILLPCHQGGRSGAATRTCPK